MNMANNSKETGGLPTVGGVWVQGMRLLPRGRRDSLSGQENENRSAPGQIHRVHQVSVKPWMQFFISKNPTKDSSNLQNNTQEQVT